MSVVIRDDKLVGATLLGDTRKVAFLTQAFDRGAAAARGADPSCCSTSSDGAEEVGVAEMPDDAQVCNCNGVTKGDICGAVAGGCGSVGGVMDRTRAGKGCGSCKSLVKQIVEWAADGDVAEDPAASLVRARHPDGQAGADGRHPRAGPAVGVSAVFAALAPGGAEDAKSKMGLTSLLKMMWGDDYVDEKDARVHQRPRARQHPARRHVLRRPADEGRRDHAGAAAPDRRRRREVRGADGEDHRRPADRPARRPQGGPAGDVGRPRACRPGYAYGKSFRTVKTCVGIGLLPVRRWATPPQLGIDLETRFQGIETPGEDEARPSPAARATAPRPT